jgi:hypothetical protein
VRAELAAVELLGDRVRPDYMIDPKYVPQMSAGEYLQATDAWDSSAADEPGELATASGEGRANADRILAENGSLVTAAAGSRAACAATATDVEVPADGVAIRAGREDATVQARRFFEQFQTTPVATVPAGETVVLRPAAADGIAVPWQIRVNGAGVRVCPRAS